MITSVTPACWILALFVRDDNERFLLGSGAYEFKESQQHFEANTIENDIIQVQGNDGSLVAGQVRRASTQAFDGFVGDATTTKAQIEQYRRNFLAFFAKNHFYTVIYVFADGSAIQRKQGFLVDAPEVKEIWQKFPEYHVALNFEDVNYYQYDEDSEGQEIYGKTATVTPSGVQSGGEVWDAIGQEWDAIGKVWEEGSGGSVNIITTESIAYVAPVITFTATTQNPILTNLTTGQVIEFVGNVAVGQTLVIDTGRKTAKLNGTSVLSSISGDWLMLAPGTNRLVLTTGNNDAPDATLEWQEIVG